MHVLSTKVGRIATTSLSNQCVETLYKYQLRAPASHRFHAIRTCRCTRNLNSRNWTMVLHTLNEPVSSGSVRWRLGRT